RLALRECGGTCPERGVSCGTDLYHAVRLMAGAGVVLSGLTAGCGSSLALLLAASASLIRGIRRTVAGGRALFSVDAGREKIRFARSSGIGVALLLLLVLPAHPLLGPNVKQPKRVLILY